MPGLMRILRIPFSTNVERVALALGHKGMTAEWVEVDPADRSPVRELSGQDLVPVLETDHGEVVADSMRIVAWLESHRPAPPLWPADHRAAHRGRRVRRVVQPRLEGARPTRSTRELGAPEPDQARIDAHAERDARLAALVRGPARRPRSTSWATHSGPPTCAPSRFSSTASCTTPTDDEPFHQILMEHLPIRGSFPRVEAWVRRVDEPSAWLRSKPDRTFRAR